MTVFVSEEQVAMAIDAAAFQVDAGGCYLVGDIARRRAARFKAHDILMMFAQPATDDVYKVADAVGNLIRDAAREYVVRERAGASASMNGALDYLELRIVQQVVAELDQVRATGASGFSLSTPVDQEAKTAD